MSANSTPARQSSHLIYVGCFAYCIRDGDCIWLYDNVLLFLYTTITTLTKQHTFSDNTFTVSVWVFVAQSVVPEWTVCNADLFSREVFAHIGNRAEIMVFVRLKQMQVNDRSLLFIFHVLLNFGAKVIELLQILKKCRVFN